MPAPLMVGFTPNIIVEGAYIVRITALDATTGNVTAGVKVTSAAILAEDLSPQEGTDKVPAVDAAFTFEGSA